MNQLYFSVSNILPLGWAACGVAVVAALYLLIFYRRRVGRVAKAAKAQTPAGESAEAGGANLPPLSVVVYSLDHHTGLEKLLPQILEQDYPAPVEVIVVNDGSCDEVEELVTRTAQLHSNLYYTFAPDSAHNLSRRKLCLQLGIKAAKHPFVVLTSAECSVDSPRWLRSMAHPFTQGKSVALGYASFSGLKRSCKRFDEAATALPWLNAALGGKPYRGTGFNLAYRKQLFFDVKGFSKSLTLHYGDDDLFINQITNEQNTAVVLTPDSLLRTEFHRPAKALREMRLRHCFTGRKLPMAQRRLFGFGTAMMWVWLAATAVGAIFTIPNLLPSCLLLLLIPALWIPLVIAWRRSAEAIGIKLSPILLPWQMMWHWVTNLRYRLRCGASSRRNYTWHQN